ncbi:MAG: GAF domain-containing sensor histidine kinase [Gemmatimonadetes bacterium]|nr:GAF domain-containing sensor histidine kinase [Gemmatimonadota bacterium]
MAEERRRPEQLQHRLEQLIRAGIRINAERELRHVLQEVADAAREVIGARYTALGVLNPEGTGLGTFVASGLTPEEQARIGALPQGRGVLGLLITDPKPLRLPDVTKHPKFYGFPANHPRMRSFLGVPVVGRRGPIGNLYLAEKTGMPKFTTEDEAIAVMLAAQAAGAVENARLNEEAQRLLGEVRAMQKSRDRFYAMINHELRNALTAVYGWADLLIRRGTQGLPRAAVEVYESAERTLTLLNDLLDLSRLDASRLQPIVRETDACHIVSEAIQAVQPAAQARSVRLETRWGDGAIACRTDPVRVRQIIINLLTNAVRHSPEGEAVTIELRDTEARVRIDVVDRGEGLTAEQQAVVFDAFMRAGPENERGTGLGLTLSRQLARLLGGDLRLESQAGAGARFILEIPRFLS